MLFERSVNCGKLVKNRLAQGPCIISIFVYQAFLLSYLTGTSLAIRNHAPSLT